jgi:hypothetical protein
MVARPLVISPDLLTDQLLVENPYEACVELKALGGRWDRSCTLTTVATGGPPSSSTTPCDEGGERGERWRRQLLPRPRQPRRVQPHGAALLTMSRRLGHSGIQVTADIYSHTVQELDRQAAERDGGAPEGEGQVRAARDIHWSGVDDNWMTFGLQRPQSHFVEKVNPQVKQPSARSSMD